MLEHRGESPLTDRRMLKAALTTSMDSMYQQIILDHYKHPTHRGEIDAFDAEVHHVNPTCGDEITLRLKLGRRTDRGPGLGEARVARSARRPPR